tara:strand:- start:77 stop:841 length:765 start_codon:yes stop_codon:yes gene_type:complete
MEIRKAIILAGGFGTRLGEFTQFSPKPMIKIGNKPILKHIIDLYSSYGVEEFYIALGYKSEVIVNYFLKNFKKKTIIKSKLFNKIVIDKNITINLIFTGKNTMTGGRLLRLKKYIKDENFHMTYGDGLANVNIKKLSKFHILNKKISTITAVHPPARFGELKINKSLHVINFKEKPQINLGWINGGFFVLNKKIFHYLKNDKTIFEKSPLEQLSKKKNLVAFQHYGFWQCVDTRRDKDHLNTIYKNKGPFWLKK